MTLILLCWVYPEFNEPHNHIGSNSESDRNLEMLQAELKRYFVPFYNAISFVILTSLIKILQQNKFYKGMSIIFIEVELQVKK